MTIPEKLYYPLKEAAQRLECSLDDLIHFAALGQLEICARIGKNDILWEHPSEQVFERIRELEKAGIGNYFLADSVSVKALDGSLEISWNKEAVDSSFETGFGSFYLNIIQEWKGRIVLTANTLFAIPQYKFHEIEHSQNHESTHIKASRLTLPGGYLLRDSLGFEFDGNSPNSFFQIGSGVEIPFSEFVVTARELELFVSRGKPVPKQELQVEEKILTSTERNTLLVIISALLQELKISPADRGTAAYLEKLTIDIGAKITEETILGKLRQIPESLERRKK